MKRATVALAPRPPDQEAKRSRTAQLLVQIPSLTVTSQPTTKEPSHIIHIGTELEEPSAINTIMEEPDTDQSCEVDEEESVSMLSDVIAQHMDITEPLTTLRTLLEQRLAISLANYNFYLQDTQELDASKNLVNQCVQGEGLVQVNLEISNKGGVKKINIVDVLKPADEVGMTPELETATDETEQVVRWVVSPEFKALQDKFKIPNEPTLWTVDHVKHWIQWATCHFSLVGISDDWNLNGKQLCEMSHSDFSSKVPLDPGDLFWTHLELLRKCQIVAVVQQPAYVQQLNQIFTTVTKSYSLKSKSKSPKVGAPRVAYEGGPGNRAGNNGQIQLWQFLLEMLTDRECQDYIRWLGEDGEFKLLNPEMVAQLWGLRKNKPTMNYEKLSRALRYYYDGDMIAKVHGKRFVYKFVCDLKSLLGYSAAELTRLVEGSSTTKRIRNQDCQILVPISASALTLQTADS